MRTARAGLTPWDCRKIMISLMIFCSAQLEAMRLTRIGPTPGTSPRRLGSASIRSKTPSPNAFTSLCAKWGPMPLINPDPRYFSMPSRVVGSEAFINSALNCKPWSRLLSHRPLAWR
jgi:hypothetical protein